MNLSWAIYRVWSRPKGGVFFLSHNATLGKPGQMVAQDLRRCRIDRVKNPVRTEELQWK
jgi:hypothetical protein